MSILLSFVFVALASASPFQNGQRKIDPKDAPNAAGLYYKDSQQVFCSATMIDESTAISAAHCPLVRVERESTSYVKGKASDVLGLRNIVLNSSKDRPVSEAEFNRFYNIALRGLPKSVSERPKYALKDASMVGVLPLGFRTVWAFKGNKVVRRHLPSSRAYFFPIEKSRIGLKAGGVDFLIESYEVNKKFFKEGFENVIATGDLAVLKLKKKSSKSWPGKIISLPKQDQCNAIRGNTNSVVVSQDRAIFTKSNWDEIVSKFRAFADQFGKLPEVALLTLQIKQQLDQISSSVQVIQGQTVQFYPEVGVYVRVFIERFRSVQKKIVSSSKRSELKSKLDQLEVDLNVKGRMVGETVFDPFDLSFINLNDDVISLRRFVGMTYGGSSGHGLVLDASRAENPPPRPPQPILLAVFSGTPIGDAPDVEDTWVKASQLANTDPDKARELLSSSRKKGLIGEYPGIVSKSDHVSLCSEGARSFFIDQGLLLGPRKSVGEKGR